MTYFRNLSGSVSKVPTGGTATNNTGSLLSKGTPVSIDETSGDIELIDVSNEDSSKAGFAVVRIDSPAGSSLEYVTSGKIEDISVAFNFGATVYVSKSGGLTDVAPAIGVGGFVEGDFMIMIGRVAKNNSDPLKKDLLVNIEPPIQI